MRFINNTSDLSKYLGIRIENQALIKKISTDTRTIKQGSLFIAIKGKNFNGNDYVQDAFKKGAVLALVDDLRFKDSKNKKIIYVKNTIESLTKIGKNIIKDFEGKVIAITGSNGKTSTTSIVADSLRKVSTTIENFNNEIGVPLSLIEKIRERIEKYQQIIGVLSTISVAVLSALLILNVALRKVIQLLNLLDLCLQDCAEGEIDQEEVDAELLAAITLEANDGTPAGPYIVNGFTLEVQEESQEKAVGSLKRRFAVGKNSQGIILLRGEKSFSSGDQILLNELKFYIESNNLQAD